MKELFSEILTLQKERFEKPSHSRFTAIDVDLQKVQTITGARRTGKSALLRLTIAELLEKGVKWDQICFLSLEDERLRTADYEPDEILQAFGEMHPKNPLSKSVYFFFDEIQYLHHWEQFVNRVHEQVSRKVIITGSNSRTLHTEVAGVLRGRGLPTELLPLSFSEYLKWKGLSFSKYGKGKIEIKAAFHTYLYQGGYPETVDQNQDYHFRLLQEYFNTVMYRDIIEQHQPANYRYLRYLYHRIADNTGKPTGLSKIYRELKSRGYAVSRGSIYEMADLGEAVYLYKRISRFDPSLIKRENADKKCYFVDNGMLRALSSQFSENKGILLENLVFWQLYRLYGNIYTTDIFYYKDATHECDFVLYKEGGQALPVQVTWEMNSETTRRREIKGLIKACEATDSKKGIILSYDSTEEITEEDIHIKVIPVWQWCGGGLDLYQL